jgi:AcrR family transcriptional regulator
MAVGSNLERRADVRAGIVDAAARLLREGGAHAVTTRAVADAAGVPAPTIFRIFGDKDGLMESVAERVMADYVATKSAQAAGEHGDPVEDLRAAWRTHIDFGLANPDLFVLLAAPGRLQRSPATAAGADVLKTRVGRVAAAGLLRVSTDRAVGMIHAAGNGVVLTLLGTPEHERDTGLADAMFDAVLAGILASTTAPPTTELAALTVAFDAAVPGLPTLSDGERTLLTEWLARAIAELQD